jgi:acyl-CoA synthetase (AMP-forming)/AMP-acid ligase II/2-methylisocitrate lyase-like PEP mutase family enzyme
VNREDGGAGRIGNHGMEQLTLIKLMAGVEAALPAILAEDAPPLTHARLKELVTQSVRELNSFGVGRNDRVALVLPQGPEMAAAFLAVAAGAACAPLNPAYRAQEYEFYLEDLQPKAIILEKDKASAAREVAESRDLPVVELEPCPDQGAGCFRLHGKSAACHAPGGFAEKEDTALVLHTSGTTSRPKMVPLTQANLCASALHIGAALRLEPSDRCLNMMPLFHIHGLIAAVLASLAAGGSVACMREFNPLRFWDWLREFNSTWFTAVPTMHQAILNQAGSNAAGWRKAALRFIRSSSSALPPQVMQGLEQCFGVSVIEAYGMTEAAHQMASNPLPPRARKAGSVGPAAGPEVAIMDEAGQLLENGLTGEIVIRGPNVTPGYVNNPEANATTFSNGWFRTGDQGYLDPEQYLFITGRIKELINRGGEKISPREIDETLMDHPAVAQAIAFAMPDSRVGEEVGAAVVLRTGQAVTEIELQRFAARRLTDFKVPRRIVFLAEIPKGPTGKPHRVGLAGKLGIKAETNRSEAPFVAPRTKTEETLAELWREVLRISPVGVHDHFFRKGGDSLSATRLAARIQHVLRFDFPVALLFQKATIAEQAEMIEQSRPLHLSSELESRLLAEMEQLTDEEARRLLLEITPASAATADATPRKSPAMMNPTCRSKQLQQAAQKGILPVIGIYDVFSATLAARHFPALFLSGFGLAASQYGLPDIGFVAWPDMVSLVQRIRVLLPEVHLLVDIDDGYGDSEIAAQVARAMETAGASGVVLEDQQRPRRCGHLDGKRILPLPEYLEKLRRVLAVRRDLFVVARTDAQEPEDIRQRLQGFASAGADAVLADGLKDMSWLRQFRREISCPVAFNQMAGGKSPACRLSQLAECGVSLVIYSTPCLFAAQTGVENALKHLLHHDGELPPNSVNLQECNAVLHSNLTRHGL